MKRILISFPILIILLLCGCGNKTEAAPPFFKAEDAQTGGEVYMLGTMHSLPKGMEYPESVYSALDECGIFACEVDMHTLSADSAEIAEAMKILECESAEDFMGEDYVEIKSYFQKQGIYSESLERYIPAVWSSALSNKIAAECGYSSQHGTDRVLQTYAEKQGMEIHALETAAEQYRINAGESRELQNWALASAVETDWEQQKEQTRKLCMAWSAGDGAALETMLSEDVPPEELTDDYSDFYTAMYEDRQRKMADYAINALQSGEKVFLAVGALHYYAEPDILDFLEQAGYKAAAVYE